MKKNLATMELTGKIIFHTIFKSFTILQPWFGLSHMAILNAGDLVPYCNA
jgi:hypothetical protein